MRFRHNVEEIYKRVWGLLPSNILIHWSTQPCANPVCFKKRRRILYQGSDNAECVWRPHYLFNLPVQFCSLWYYLFTNQVTIIWGYTWWIQKSYRRCFPKKIIQDYHDANQRQSLCEIKSIIWPEILVWTMQHWGKSRSRN